jgi:hypothetical protein
MMMARIYHQNSARDARPVNVLHFARTVLDAETMFLMYWGSHFLKLSSRKFFQISALSKYRIADARLFHLRV